MITALISVGSGIVVGLGLLIWGLRERSAKHKAEMNLQLARATNTKLRTEVSTLQVDVEQGTQREQGSARQVKVLRGAIDELRVKLRTCRDPATVRLWLDEQLGKDKL